MPNAFKELVYEGSVKTVCRDVKNPAINYFAYTDDYSVFDWGKMPDQIQYKGKALSIIGGALFKQLSQPETWKSMEQSPALKLFKQGFLTQVFASSTYKKLCESGMQHHFLGWVNEQGETIPPEQLASAQIAPMLKVRSLEITRPRKFTLDNYTLYNYDLPDTTCSTCNTPFLIPLEVVFRFGMPEGSSLQKRLDKNPHYYAELGLLAAPEKNKMFERPVLEFFTKLEPSDRFLTPQEAFLISGLSEAQFSALYDKTLLLALWLFNAFASKGIELWDGKFEFAWSPEGLMLVDSIGPDELRLIYQGVQLSKEVIRQFYKDSSWEKAVREAKVIAQSKPGSDWKKICIQQLGQAPQPLSSSEKRLVDNLYATLINYFLEQPYIETSMTFEEVISALKQAQPVGVR